MKILKALKSSFVLLILFFCFKCISASEESEKEVSIDKLSRPVLSSSDDSLFSDLGETWELFKKGDYNSSFSKIYVLSCKKNPKAEYLLGEFYEIGLGEILRSPKDAAEFYTRAIVDSKDLYLLREKSETALKRILSEYDKSTVQKSDSFSRKIEELSIEELSLEFESLSLGCDEKYEKEENEFYPLLRKKFISKKRNLSVIQDFIKQKYSRYLVTKFIKSWPLSQRILSEFTKVGSSPSNTSLVMITKLKDPEKYGILEESSRRFWAWLQSIQLKDLNLTNEDIQEMANYLRMN